MKYGIIVFKNTENIGDDIQSYAASRLLPRVDYFIEREEMDLFIPKKDEQVVTIMNGWFLHQKTSFPPSPFINPIFISTHFSNYNTYSLSDEHIVENKDYLLSNGPIGCRDFSTKHLLDKHNIDNYFSGCLTLTIDCNWEKPHKKNLIYCVDVDKEIVNSLKKTREEEVEELTHTLNPNVNSKLSWIERFQNVENLLKKYQQAKIVITSRLHCALPCLALGVNVLFVNKNDEKYFNDRINDYLMYLNHCSKSELLKTGIDSFINKDNPNAYKEIRNNLKNKLDEEITEKSQKVLEIPSISNYESLYVNPKRKLNKLYKKISSDYKIISDKCLKKDNENAYLKKELKSTNEYWKKEFANLVDVKEKEIEETIDYWKNEFNGLEQAKNKDLDNIVVAKDKELEEAVIYWKKEFASLEKAKNKELKDLLKKNEELYSILNEHEVEFKRLNERVWYYENIISKYGGRKLKKLAANIPEEEKNVL